MIITAETLQKVYKEAPEERINKFIEPLNVAMGRYSINTPQRIRMFLAQIGHESARLRYVKEIASGEAYDTGRKAANLGNTPEEDGDGQLYKGRGLIQITGRRNYLLCGLALDLPLLEHPELLETPMNAAMSAGWFWENNNLNALCDAGYFKELTRRINGGVNGYADRYKLYQRAFDVIK